MSIQLGPDLNKWPDAIRKRYQERRLRARQSTEHRITVGNLTLPAPHPSQQYVLNAERRWNILCCGRRWGKTTIAIDRLVRPAMEGYPVAYFSPYYKMLTDVWREMKHILLPATARKSDQEHRIELTTGGIVDMWSLDNADAVRGRKYKRVVVDEAAMVKDLENAFQAVIRPTLTDYEGDAWFPSTPKGMGYFKMLFDKGQDQAKPDWVSWRIPTSESPYITAGEIESAKRELPERIFAQEYLAEFLDDGGGVFRKVQEAATANQIEYGLEGHDYLIGADWGKYQDFTVLTVLDTLTKEVVKIDRFNQIDYAVQISRLTALCGRFRTKSIIPERNSMGEPLIEQLQREGYSVHPFTTTNASKAEAIDALALAFERGELKIPNDPVLIAELLAYDAERLPSGMLRYGAPARMHDDCVMSLALAWSGVSQQLVKVKPFSIPQRNPWLIK